MKTLGYSLWTDVLSKSYLQRLVYECVLCFLYPLNEAGLGCTISVGYRAA